MAQSSDRHGLAVLPLAQSLTLLRSRPVGRLAYVSQGAPVVTPVNHLVDGATVVFRTLDGGKLDAAVVGAPVAFHLDDYDVERGAGWSVLVQGTATIVEDADRIARYEESLSSWADPTGEHSTWVQVIADEISGRRLERRGAP